MNYKISTQRNCSTCFKTPSLYQDVIRFQISMGKMLRMQIAHGIRNLFRNMPSQVSSQTTSIMRGVGIDKMKQSFLLIKIEIHLTNCLRTNATARYYPTSWGGWQVPSRDPPCYGILEIPTKPVTTRPTTVSRRYAYADDLAIMHANGDWQVVEGLLSKDIVTVDENPNTWKLKLSTTKTVSAVFRLNKEAKPELKVNHNNKNLPFWSEP